MQFSVMSFNIRGSYHDQDGDNVWEGRAALNIATIKTYAPDIIGFQEWQQGNKASYDAHLSEYTYEMGPVSIRQTERRHHLAIYWKPERFKRVRSGGFYLSETPDEWSTGWGARLVRAVNWVHLREKGSGQEFVCLNTHFDHESDEARKHSAALIVERLQSICGETLPALVTADFNARPDHEAYRHFQQHGYRDTWVQAGHTDNPNTFHGFKGERFSWQGARIDWILTKDGAQRFAVQSAQIITDAEPPLYPSDHYPILANLILD